MTSIPETEQAEMATVTIVQTDAPSRSKQAGPCWIAIEEPGGDYLYAATTVRSVELPVGSTVTVAGKVTLRRAGGRPAVERKEWTLVVTGDPTDTVAVRLGSPQSVDATLTGVRER